MLEEENPRRGGGWGGAYSLGINFGSQNRKPRVPPGGGPPLKSGSKSLQQEWFLVSASAHPRWGGVGRLGLERLRFLG